MLKQAWILLRFNIVLRMTHIPARNSGLYIVKRCFMDVFIPELGLVWVCHKATPLAVNVADYSLAC
jgi:hypothetical protein